MRDWRASRSERFERARNGDPDVPHATAGGYTNWGCRCNACRIAWAEYIQRARTRRAERLDEAPHGTRSGYSNWGCRCDECRAAHTAFRREERKRGRAA